MASPINAYRLRELVGAGAQIELTYPSDAASERFFRTRAHG